MINTSKAASELSPQEIYAIEWFNENGFEGEVTYQWQTKTGFKIKKDGVTDTFTLPHSKALSRKTNLVTYMEQYGKQFRMLCQFQSAVGVNKK